MASRESAIIAFYRGHGRDAAGRALFEILDWDERRLEMVHDYIQWLFPLPDPSRFNPAAPILTVTDIETFRADAGLQDNVRRALDRVLTFFGLARGDGLIVRGPGFANAHWLTPANHNHLRLTRIVLFLHYAGLVREAQALLVCLEEIAAHEGRAVISARTLAFWREAGVARP